MNRSRLAAAGLVGALALWTVCGVASCYDGTVSVRPTEARCLRLCKDSKSCPAVQGKPAFDCYGSCDDLEGLNRANECYDEAEDFYDCIEKHGVCSDIDAECIEQQDVYSDCLAEPCSLDPERDICG